MAGGTPDSQGQQIIYGLVHNTKIIGACLSTQLSFMEDYLMEDTWI